MTPAVNRTLSDPEVRKVLIETLAFVNVISECKKVIKPLKARLASIDKWIRNTADIGSHTYDATLIEVISKGFKKRLSNVLTWASKVTSIGIVGKAFLETFF